MAKKKQPEKPQYSFKVGLKKTAKNVLVMFVVPAAIYIADSMVEFTPDEYKPLMAVAGASIAYLSKNYIENRGRK